MQLPINRPPNIYLQVVKYQASLADPYTLTRKKHVFLTNETQNMLSGLSPYRGL